MSSAVTVAHSKQAEREPREHRAQLPQRDRDRRRLTRHDDRPCLRVADHDRCYFGHSSSTAAHARLVGLQRSPSTTAHPRLVGRRRSPPSGAGEIGWQRRRPVGGTPPVVHQNEKGLVDVPESLADVGIELQIGIR
jgi:hypothetical protein